MKRGMKGWLAGAAPGLLLQYELLLRADAVCAPSQAPTCDP